MPHKNQPAFGSRLVGCTRGCTRDQHHPAVGFEASIFQPKTGARPQDEGWLGSYRSFALFTTAVATSDHLQVCPSSDLQRPTRLQPYNRINNGLHGIGRNLRTA